MGSFNMPKIWMLSCITLVLVMLLAPQILQGAIPNPGIGVIRNGKNETTTAPAWIHGRNSNRSKTRGKGTRSQNAVAPLKLSPGTSPDQDAVKDFNSNTIQKTGLHTHDTGSVYNRHF